MSSSKSSDSNVRDLEERLDFLLSVEVDDELSSAERDELLAIRRDSPEVVAQLTARRAEFATGDTVLRRVVGTPMSSSERVAVDSSANASADADFEASLRESFEAIQARLADASGNAIGSELDLTPSERASEVDPDLPVDELAKRRRASRSWVPPVVLAAAAAWVLYLVIPSDGSSPSSKYLDVNRDLAAESARSGLSASETLADAAKDTKEEVLLRKSSAAGDAMLAQADASASALESAPPISPSLAPSFAPSSAPTRSKTVQPASPSADRSATPSFSPPQIAEERTRPRAENLARSISAESFAAADSALGDLTTAIRPGLAAASSAVPTQANAGLAALRESKGARPDEGLEPLELAVMFGPDAGGDEAGSGEVLSAEDFEIIEQLELLEYLATQSGGRG